MLTFKSYILKEGGNVFTNTGRISREDVIPTVQHLERITGLPLLNNMLGTTGRAADSGDIDLVIDTKTISKVTLENKLQEFWKKNNNDIIGTKKSGVSVHFLSPVWNKEGKETGNFVQVDFMFHDDPEYLKFFYAANEQAPFKGRDRNILLSAIAKHKGLTLSTNGLFSRETKQLISRDPNIIARAIFDENSTAKDLNNIQTITKKLVQIYGSTQAKEIVNDAEETTGHTFL
jgi:DNA polymerase/3'-5' exonuclease PolX